MQGVAFDHCCAHAIPRISIECRGLLQAFVITCDARFFAHPLDLLVLEMLRWPILKDHSLPHQPTMLPVAFLAASGFMALAYQFASRTPVMHGLILREGYRLLTSPICGPTKAGYIWQLCLSCSTGSNWPVAQATHDERHCDGCADDGLRYDLHPTAFARLADGTTGGFMMLERSAFAVFDDSIRRNTLRY
jgi:hypothetical protein